jgi:hypothetical protein
MLWVGRDGFTSRIRCGQPSIGAKRSRTVPGSRRASSLRTTKIGSCVRVAVRIASMYTSRHSRNASHTGRPVAPSADMAYESGDRVVRSTTMRASAGSRPLSDVCNQAGSFEPSMMAGTPTLSRTRAIARCGVACSTCSIRESVQIAHRRPMPAQGRHPTGSVKKPYCST